MKPLHYVVISFNMLFDWPVVNYKLFESPNIADMGVYFLFIKLLMVCYFNCALFKVTYSMLRFFTVALLMPYCLLAFKVSFFSDIIFNVVLLNAVFLCCNFYFYILFYFFIFNFCFLLFLLCFSLCFQTSLKKHFTVICFHF